MALRPVLPRSRLLTGFLLASALLASLARLPAAPAPAQHRLAPRTPQDLRQIFAPGSGTLPIVSGHRGGAWHGFPENCIPTFERTLAHTYAIFEIDPRYTKDRAVVVHHDPTLDRTTTGRGKLTDATLAEIRQLHLKDLGGKVTELRVPTLDEVIAWARGRAILILDQKDVSALDRARIVARHQAEHFILLIVGSYKDVQAVYAAHPNQMMEVFVGTLAKAEEFDRLGVPWSNVVAFVGHTPPEDPALYEFIHRRGARCIVGSSRNLDRRLLTGQIADLAPLAPDYRAFLARGADLIETDLPALVGPLLHRHTPVPAALRPLFQAP